MINRSVLVGRITRDPELRKTQNGHSVVSFTLAVNRRFKKEGQQDADFINCVAWNNQADFLAQYIQKGTLLGVEGRLQSRTYDDNDNKTVYIQEVVCDAVQALESKSQRDNQSQGNQVHNSQTYEQSYTANDDNEAILQIDSDDLPF